MFCETFIAIFLVKFCLKSPEPTFLVMCTSANRPFTMQTGDTIAELRISPYIGGSYLAENKLAPSLSAGTLL